MTSRSFLLLVLVLSLAAASPVVVAAHPFQLPLPVFLTALPQSQPHTHGQDVATRGDHVMGFSHEKTTHHFRLFPDGGEIAVSANDPADALSISQIRTHLSHIAQMFADGNFQAPMLIHDTNPPGTATMARLKSEIRYDFSSTPTGAAIRIRTGDSAATDAIHAFLLFQILDHHTNDSPAIAKPPAAI